MIASGRCRLHVAGDGAQRSISNSGKAALLVN
jgi:hypothetical protein